MFDWIINDMNLRISWFGNVLLKEFYISFVNISANNGQVVEKVRVKVESNEDTWAFWKEEPVNR